MNTNLERTRTALNAWNRHDLESYRTLYAPDARLHGFAPAPIDVPTLLAGYQAFFAGFPNLHLDLLDSIPDREKLALRVRLRGTHRGDFQGIPATGRSIDVEIMTILHFREGKVIERWNQLEQMGLMLQLGVIPAAAG
jgi:ketosteroid isomerase-like protein